MTTEDKLQQAEAQVTEVTQANVELRDSINTIRQQTVERCVQKIKDTPTLVVELGEREIHTISKNDIITAIKAEFGGKNEKP